MIKLLKWTLAILLSLVIIGITSAYLILRGSLPSLDGEVATQFISQQASLERDEIGTAVVKAATQNDAAYVLGYAHAQDRLFQMDLLRRQAAGELSELVGSRALSLDKKHRIHQFRQRAQAIYDSMPVEYKVLLEHYTEGVNAGAKSLTTKPFEYYLLGGSFRDWQPADSLLASYSMYIDLQLAQTEIDFRLTALKQLFGDNMHAFFTLPSQYQASIDGSRVAVPNINIPTLPTLSDASSANTKINHSRKRSTVAYNSVLEQPDYGSNNWAVSGDLTQSNGAMLSNDMHLSLRVPAIWYRAQLNYSDDGQDIKITGVSLPGTPAIIVGSNGNIAWGFTNSNIDNVDWIALDPDTNTTMVDEVIMTPDGEQVFSFEMSDYGPVRELDGIKYALKWVAHQDYAVNIAIADMPQLNSVEEALALSTRMRMPVQNMVVADATGSIAWQLTGAIAGRTNLKRHAISEQEFAAFAELWEIGETKPANMYNPENGRVWTANARVVGTEDLARFGDGGYALGARQQQIMRGLFAQNTFSEKSFYDLQLDNRALFLTSWHELLLETLKNTPQKYAEDIQALHDWQACACANSVGYTLVRRFRSTVINQLFDRLNQELQAHELSTSYLLRSIEPAAWALLQAQSPSWLPEEHSDYTAFLISAYDTTKQRLLDNHSSDKRSLSELSWGKVNALKVRHPFAAQLGPFASLLNMKEYPGFGDSYTPAVQSGSFGASQRLIVRPGDESKGILTVPGGQSGHFLSTYYEKGFEQYATQKNTPLLPGKKAHSISFILEK